MVTVRSGSRKRSEGGIDALGVVFDDDNAVANAGLVLPATLAGRLGLERLVDETLDLGLRPGAFSPGRLLARAQGDEPRALDPRRRRLDR